MKDSGTVGIDWWEPIEEIDGQMMRLIAMSQSSYYIVYFICILVGSTLVDYFASVAVNF